MLFRRDRQRTVPGGLVFELPTHSDNVIVDVVDDGEKRATRITVITKFFQNLTDRFGFKHHIEVTLGKVRKVPGALFVVSDAEQVVKSR